MAKLASAAHPHLRVLELPGAILTALKEAPEGFRLTRTTPPPRPGSAWSSWRWDGGEIQTEDCSESLSLCGPAAGELALFYSTTWWERARGLQVSSHRGQRAVSSQSHRPGAAAPLRRGLSEGFSGALKAWQRNKWMSCDAPLLHNLMRWVQSLQERSHVAGLANPPKAARSQCSAAPNTPKDILAL